MSNDGVIYPLDYSIQDIDLFTSGGQKFNIRRLMGVFNYYEDIFGFCSSGSIVLIDAQGFIEKMQLTGNEFLQINIGKVKDDPANIVENFRCYKIDKAKPTGNMNSVTYELFFCSEELLLSEQTKVSQSYKGQTITFIITDILAKKLQVHSNKVGIIEETTGVYDFVVPTMKPFEAISWLSNYAMQTKYKGADMLFYQTREGFNFRSLQSIYSDEVYATYQYSAKNIDEADQGVNAKQNSVQKYEIQKPHDALHEADAGTFANRLLSIDPLTRSHYTTDFDYSSYQKSSTSLNKEPAAETYKNRLGNTQSNSFESTLKVTHSNQNQANVKYIKTKAGSVSNDMFSEKTIPMRTAQLALMNYTKIKMTIPGDTGITVGKIIIFNLNSLDASTPNKEVDKNYAGKYVVTAVRHMFTQTQFQTILEICKDSSPSAYQTPQESQDWQEAKNT